jgi:hypothetical protein
MADYSKMIQELVAKLGVENIRSLAKAACPLTQEQLIRAAALAVQPHEENKDG